MSETTKPRMSAARFREKWEAAQLDMFDLMARTIETQQELHMLVAIHAEIYEGVMGEEAPEMDMRTRMSGKAS